MADLSPLTRALRLLLWFCIGIAIPAVPMLSYAEGTVSYNAGTGGEPIARPVVYSMVNGGSYGVGGTGATALEACQNHVVLANAVSAGNPSFWNGWLEDVQCRSSYSYGPSYYHGDVMSSYGDCPAGYQVSATNSAQCVPTPGTCPANSTGPTGTAPNQVCTCNNGFDAQNGQCVARTCQAGQKVTGQIPATASPAVVCWSGCEGTVSSASNQYQKDGQPVIAGTWVLSGASCTGNWQNSGSAPPDDKTCPPGAAAQTGFGTIGGVDYSYCKCPAGTTFGSATINGQTTSGCYPSSATNPATQYSTEKTTDANNQTTESTQKRTDNGEKVTDEKTTKNPDGSMSTTKKEQSKATFCEENPTAAICKSVDRNGASSAACSAPPSCSGDAIDCAMVRQQWETMCKAEKDLEPLAAVADEAHMTFDSAAAASALNKNGASDFNLFAVWQSKRQNYLSYVAECPAAPVIEFKGTVINLQPAFDVMCQFGAIVRLFVHIMAYMGVLAMFTKRF